MDFSTLLEDLTDVEAITAIDPQGAVYLLAVLLVFYVGKRVYDWLTPYDLNEQLTTVDNKAVALAYGGYILGLGIILWGVLGGEPPTEAALDAVAEGEEVVVGHWANLLSIAVWGLVGILLLIAAAFINDKLLLSRFSNVKELVEDKNVGTGAVQCGALIGSALMVRAALSGDPEGGGGYGGFAGELAATVIFFLAGQLAFIAFGFLYQKVTRYDLHDEIERDNVAAGVGFGMSLVAVGIVLSSYLVRHASLIGLAAWFVLCAFFLLTTRFLVDKFILPGDLLDEEISKDRNWGAAVVEGASALGLALLLHTAFS